MSNDDKIRYLLRMKHEQEKVEIMIYLGGMEKWRID